MTIRTLIAAVGLITFISTPALAQRVGYTVTAEQQIHTPLGVDSFPAGTWEGPASRMEMTDNGDGTVTLNALVLHNALVNQFDASGTTVPNCFATTTANVRNRAPVGETGAIAGGGALGTGDVTFGLLEGWSSDGAIYCFEELYSGTTGGGEPIPPVLEVGTCGGCAFGAGLIHDGWGQGPGVTPDHNTDGWTFAGDLSTFSITPHIEFFNTLGGAVFGQMHNISGAQVSPLPALAPVGLGLLGASLAYMGARTLRRRRSD